MTFYKYHGAGNDFLLADGRNENVELSAEQISALCERHTGIGADGVMVLEKSDSVDFKMRYYNSDGSGGMMCGNGGRCIVAFAADLGYSHFDFEAPDGLHTAQILDLGQNHGEGPEASATKFQTESDESMSSSCLAGGSTCFQIKSRIVRLKMRDVDEVVRYGDDWFLNTGTRHLVRFVEDVSSYDVVGQGRELRYDERFAPEGVNVNFVQRCAENVIRLRTYEKGVEDETLACGTGIVASSLASWFVDNAVYGEGQSRFGVADPDNGQAEVIDAGAAVKIDVHARIADLSVEFTPSVAPSSSFLASNVWLTGPAKYVGRIDLDV